MSDIIILSFPGESGYSVDYRCDSPAEIAGALAAKWDLGLDGGIVVGNPVPVKSEIDSGLINKAIETALKECCSQGITGKRVTPFLLSRLKDITEGRSLETNIALVKNNAELGARIAVELERFHR